MTLTLTLDPEVEDRLRSQAAVEHRSVHQTVEQAIEEYLGRRTHNDEMLVHYREVVTRNREFYDELGDR